jgi:hypothetical protein
MSAVQGVSSIFDWIVKFLGMGPFSNPGGSSYIADSIQLDVKAGNYAGGSANKFDNCRFICPDHLPQN